MLIFRLRFTIAKVQHLEIPIAVFCGFLLFLPSKTLRKVSFYLRISLEISNFVSKSKKTWKMKTKRELAQTYFPQITADSAVRKLTTWIKNCKPLTKQLAKTGYRTGTHTLTDRQIGMIFDYLGEPWEPKGNIYFSIFFYWYFIISRKTSIY